MGANVAAGATPGSANPSGINRGAAITSSPLGWGVLVGPFYLAVGLAQAFLRDGFDLMRHPLSVLANGPGGWVQTANFVLSGLMVMGAAVGFRRALAPKSRAVSWSLAIFGISMLVAAVFRADPVDGFPVGTPAGPPTSISTHGLVHFIAGTLGLTALGISCLAGAVTLSRRKLKSMARLSFVCGLVVLVAFFG